ncbi:MAG: M28 family peptidase [Chthoniobacterales bacterium]
MISRRIFVFSIFLAAVAVAWWTMIRMPGVSFRATTPPLTDEEVALRRELMADVQRLAGDIGERNVERYAQLKAAADFVESSFLAAGLRTHREGYDVGGKRCDNVAAEISGAGDGIVVIGAHYDSVLGCPGANDNGSGVAALLALARRFAAGPGGRVLRFVAFPNEEPLHFQTDKMGSSVYAAGCKGRGEKIVAMMSLETIGYFSNAQGSQRFPVPGMGAIYPTTGNFISFVGNVSSGALVRQAIGSFRRRTNFPSEGAALPASVPGIGWSDHWAFWQQGYKAIMVTDTAPFRYPHYHEPTDAPDKLDYDSMARVVAGLEDVVADLTIAR